jgi:uncharacterized protein (TIGR03067 family)
VYTFRGGVLTIQSGNEKPGKYVVKANATKTPQAIDLTLLYGPDEGKPSLGVYEVKGDVLRLCVAAQGTDRPAGFASEEHPAAGRAWLTGRPTTRAAMLDILASHP